MVRQWLLKMKRGLCCCLWLACWGTALAETQSIVLSVSPSSAQQSALDFKTQLNHSVDLNTFVLKEPDRVVLDFKGVQGPVRFTKPDSMIPFVKQVRFARNTPSTFRVVLDMNQSVNAVVKKRLSESNTLTHAVMVMVPVEASSSKASIQPLVMHLSNGEGVKKSSSVAPVPVATQQRSKDIIIMIDPGHGGKDPGATGVNGVHEKTVVLAISKKLVNYINQQQGYRAYLTRTNDHFLSLRQRMAVARKKQADIFIAIHADAFSNKRAKGASVFALSTRGATSEAARWLAEKENKSELVGGVSLADKTHLLKSVLLSLSQTATIRSSLTVGNDILSALDRVTTLHHTSVEQAAFVVLKSPDISSLLIETGFLSNPTEARRLASPQYQAKIARAIEKGVVSYFNQQPPRGTWVAQMKLDKRQGNLSYKVVRGDTLSGISSRYNITMTALISRNGLSSRQLRVGQVLEIPAA